MTETQTIISMPKIPPKMTISMLTVVYNVPPPTCGGIDVEYTWSLSGAGKFFLKAALQVVLYSVS